MAKSCFPEVLMQRRSTLPGVLDLRNQAISLKTLPGHFECNRDFSPADIGE
jgi:hypothetical protein